MILNNEQIRYLLETVKDQQSYYAGGTLCIDLPDTLDQDDTTLVLINLDETSTLTSKKYDTKNILLLDLYNITKLFLIYLEHKDCTNYVVEKLKNSCIRHLLSNETLTLLNRGVVGNQLKEPLVIDLEKLLERFKNSERYYVEHPAIIRDKASLKFYQNAAKWCEEKSYFTAGKTL